MKKILSFWLVLSLLCLTGCGFVKRYDPNMLDKFDAYNSSVSVSLDQAMAELPYDQMITQTCDVHEFLELFGEYPEGNGLLTVVAEEIGVECLRTNSAGTRYSIHKVEQGGWLYIFYRYREFDSAYYIDNWFYVNEDRSFADFDAIEIGSTIQEVEKIDPSARLSHNLFYRRCEWRRIDDVSLFSQHYLNDGVLFIYYEYQDDYLYDSKEGEYLVYDMEYFDDYVRWTDGGSGTASFLDVSLLPGDWIT